MTRTQGIGFSSIAWIAVGTFWLVTTRNYHPTWQLAGVVTVSLISVYAAAAYLNHLVLIPNYWRAGRYGMYLAALLAIMVLGTGLALAVIRVCYVQAFGPDSDPNGVYFHFGIDFLGMAAHLLGAAAVVWMIERL